MTVKKARDRHAVTLTEKEHETATSVESERIKRIHSRVSKVKASEEVGVRYMQAWEERYYDKEEARLEGLTEGRAEGEMLKLISMIRKKHQKGCSCEEIAEALEEMEKDISMILEPLKEHPEWSDEQILAHLE